MNETNRKILEEAEKLFAENGVSKTSIHDLAKACNIRVGGIYHYYSNKDEILFDILERRFREQLIELEAHLSGLTTPVAKLEKYIWAIFYNSQSDKNLSKLTLLEFRHRKELTKNPAYHPLRKMVNLVIPILQEGQQQGLFRKDVDTLTFRNMIQGTLEAFTRNWLVFNRPENILDFAPIVTQLILSAITHPPKKKKTYRWHAPTEKEIL